MHPLGENLIKKVSTSNCLGPGLWRNNFTSDGNQQKDTKRRATEEDGRHRLTDKKIKTEKGGSTFLLVHSMFACSETAEWLLLASDRVRKEIWGWIFVGGFQYWLFSQGEDSVHSLNS